MDPWKRNLHMGPNTPAPVTDRYVGLVDFFFNIPLYSHNSWLLPSSKSAFQSHCLVSSFITRLSHDLESNSV